MDDCRIVLGWTDSLQTTHVIFEQSALGPNGGDIVDISR